MMLVGTTTHQDEDRSEAFAEFAKARGKGKVTVPPSLLPEHERRVHVRQTLREDHRFRVANRPEGAQAKFDKLAKNAFKFFRGTALLYYRDQAGTDGHLPTVVSVGDVHPENFGVMPNENGAPFFGVNDFDEAFFAPFSWDVKRGAVGFWLACRENGSKKKVRRKIAGEFARGYTRGLVSFSRDDREKWHQFRLDNSPDMICALLNKSLNDRGKWLAKMVNLEKGEFHASKKIVPHSGHVDEFQGYVEKYCEDAGKNDDPRAGHFRVKDVAIKKNSGTASLGLDRYFVLIDGPSENNGDDIILEIKQARPSALYGLTPNPGRRKDDLAGRIVTAQKVHVFGGDPYYGHTEIDGQSFLVRERSPFKEEIDVDELGPDEMGEYARICGVTLAQAHARSDAEQDTEKEMDILKTIQPKVFEEDIALFAEATGKRVVADWKLFKKDHKLKAFEILDDGLS